MKTTGTCRGKIYIQLEIKDSLLSVFSLKFLVFFRTNHQLGAFHTSEIVPALWLGYKHCPLLFTYGLSFLNVYLWPSSEELICSWKDMRSPPDFDESTSFPFRVLFFVSTGIFCFEDIKHTKH